MELNDMLAPPPVYLPADPAAEDLSAAGLSAGADVSDPRTVIAHPDSPLAWATLAEQRLAQAEASGDVDDQIAAYAFARTGYHRSLDRLRANKWKGWGPVPFSHEPNQGVLRAIASLGKAAKLIGEDAEYDRIRQMLSDADPECVAKLL